ncbi:MAG: serine--tRNA ligase [Nanobdellota archaeon]
MLDIKFIRENPQAVKDNMEKKYQQDKLDIVDNLLEKDKKYRELLSESQNLRAKRNNLSENINKAKKEGKDASDIIKEAKEIPDKIKNIEKDSENLKEEINSLLMKIPNILHDSVPVGKDDSENVEIQRFGEPVKKKEDVKNHAEFAEECGLADFNSARETSGNGFYFLKGELAELEEALRQYAMDYLKKNEYTYVIPPNLIKEEVVNGVMSFAEMENMMYKIEGENLYTIGTSEHSLIGMFKGKSIIEKQLPIKIFANTTCYRKEIGSHGIDEKGVFRVHQFNKVEQIIICKPEDSYKYYEELLNNTVDIFKGLEIPIRTLEICSGDMADLKSKSADVEAWSPRREKYIEVGSCSNLTDAQARRLNIKVDGGPGNKYFAHTLNDTAIATSRALVAIIENFQNKDGTITIPKKLRPYISGKEKIKGLDNWFW